MALRRLNSSDEWSGETRMVFRISLPPITACVRCGEMSKAEIGMPVLCVTVWEAPGLEIVAVRHETWSHEQGCQLAKTSIYSHEDNDKGSNTYKDLDLV